MNCCIGLNSRAEFAVQQYFTSRLGKIWKNLVGLAV